MQTRRPVRIVSYAWLSVAAALTTMGLKALAYKITGSVGLLSDALESGVNLVAAALAVAVLRVSRRPPDDEHAFGHEKVEYFSSGFEGALILMAGASIARAALPRLWHLQPLQEIGLGLALATLASVVNGAVAAVLLKAGRKHRSVTLQADGQHLLTDVWTSAAVLIGVVLVALTGQLILDPIVALLAAAYISWVGISLVRGAFHSLMDVALDPEQIAAIEAILETYRSQGVTYHALRTRRAGSSNFVQFHVLVPGDWSVSRGHQLTEELERAIAVTIPGTRTLTHLEPLEDPISFDDIDLERQCAQG